MMPVSFDRIIDSAIVVAAVSGVLYSLGLTFAQAEAAAVGLPHMILRRDVWTTLARGFEGLIVAVLTPLTIFRHEKQLGLILGLFFAVAFAVLLCMTKLRLAVKVVGTSLIAFVALESAVFFRIHHQSTERAHTDRMCVEDATKCNCVPKLDSQVDTACDLLLQRVVWKGAQEKANVAHGRIYSLGEDYLVLITVEGIHTLPRAAVVEIVALLKRPSP